MSKQVDKTPSNNLSTLSMTGIVEGLNLVYADLVKGRWLGDEPTARDQAIGKELSDLLDELSLRVEGKKSP